MMNEDYFEKMSAGFQNRRLLGFGVTRKLEIPQDLISEDFPPYLLGI